MKKEKVKNPKTIDEIIGAATTNTSKAMFGFCIASFVYTDEWFYIFISALFFVIGIISDILEDK